MQADDFLQDPPHLGNQFVDDAFLLSLLRRLLPDEVQQEALPDLERFGWEVATYVKDLGQQAERESPELERYDAWGRHTDTVVTSAAWQRLKAVAAREGLVVAAYERQHGQHSRAVQLAKLYLFGASSGLYNCPLAMTDGAARLCELLLGRDEDQHRQQAQGGGQAQLQQALRDAFGHLTSRDPACFWTSGQWMTGKGGGSDVAAGTQTVAVPVSGEDGGVGTWFGLTGYKWFTSAADGEMSMALAREQPPQAAVAHRRPAAPGSSSSTSPAGGRGLTLFYVPVEHDAQGCPQGFEVVKLKDKLGTRQLPTAELRLTGMLALKISETGRGIPGIAAMVNITRLHNAAAAASYMRRITALAQDYARRRRVFGALLIDQPLAQRTLAWLHLHTAGSLAFSLEVARLLGLQECGVASTEDSHMLRLLTPLVKLFTAKEAVAVVSEGLEFFGGQGYIEGTHLPVILRDAQVLPIWEGTTSVLALDVLRVLGGSPQAAAAFMHQCESRMGAAMRITRSSADSATGGGSASPAGQALPADAARLLQRACTALQRRLPALGRQLQAAAKAGVGSAAVQAAARDLAFHLARQFIGVLLVEQAAWSGGELHVVLAAEWCRESLRSASGGSPLAPVQTACGGSAAEEGQAWSASLLAAQLLSGAGQPLSQPRARY